MNTFTTVLGGMTATLQDLVETGSVVTVPEASGFKTGNPTLPAGSSLPSDAKHSGGNVVARILIGEKLLVALVGIVGGLILIV